MAKLTQFARFLQAQSRGGRPCRSPLSVMFSGQGASGYDELTSIPGQLRDLLSYASSLPSESKDKEVLQQVKARDDAVDEAVTWMERTISKYGESTMTNTSLVQPVQFSYSTAIATALQRAGVVDIGARDPQFAVGPTLGHSLGEYSALTMAGMLPTATAFNLVLARGRLMQESLERFVDARKEEEKPWAMVGLMRSRSLGSPKVSFRVLVQQVCEEIHKLAVEDLQKDEDPKLARHVTRGRCTVATANSQFQVTISGGTAEVEKVVQVCRERGIISRALPLPVAAPFHCPIMQPAEKEFAKILANVELAASQEQPVIANLSAMAYPSDQTVARELLARQITGTVRWDESVEAAVRDYGAQAFLEITLGKPIILPFLERAMPTAVTCCLSSPADAVNFIDAARAVK